MKLSAFTPKKSRYTTLEYNMFAALPKNGRRVGSAHIVKNFAEKFGDNWDVKFPLKSVTTQMNRLIDKVEANKEPFRIVKDGKREGHDKVEYWLEARKRNGK